MENFENQPTEEKLKELPRHFSVEAIIRGIAEDIIGLMARNVPSEDIEKLIGKGFMDEFGEGRNIQDKIMEGLKDSSDSEIEAIATRIENYKKLKEQ
jgi:hypothetical protein